MASESLQPLELSSSLRRFASEQGDTLEQPGYPVEGDILSRIRSLRLSRNGHRTLRVPNNSDENLPRYIIDTGPGAGDVFDFSTARSVVRRSQRAGSEHLSAKSTSYRRSRLSSHISMDGGASPPPPPTAEHGTLQSAGSENDLIDFHDVETKDATNAYHSDGPSSPPPASSGERIILQLPPLVLRNKKKQNMEAIRSCRSATGEDVVCFIAYSIYPTLSPQKISILR